MLYFEVMSTLRHLLERAQQLIESRSWKTVVSLAEGLGKIAIFAGIITWFWGIPERRTASDTAAWQLLNSAHGSVAGGRHQALRVLSSHGADLSGLDLRKVNLPQADFAGASATGADFSQAYMNNADFSRSTIALTRFDGTSLQYARFVGSSVSNLAFQENDMSSANFSSPSFWERISHFSRRYSELTDVTFNEVHLDKASFAGAHLLRVRFKSTIPEEQLDFSRSLMRGVIFDGVYSSVIGKHTLSFDFASLCNVDVHQFFGGVSFRNATLRYVDFRKAKIAAIDFEGATFENVLFTSKQLSELNIDVVQRQSLNRSKPFEFMSFASMQACGMIE